MDTDKYSALEDKALNAKAPRSSRQGGRGGQPREVQISKALSRLLRHQASNAGITLTSSGYAPLPAVLAWGPLRSLKVTFAEIQEVVKDNEKQRFSLALRDGAAEGSADVDDYLIRANQGHSIKMESEGLMEEVSAGKGNIPPRVVHGTYFAFWDDIIKTGGLKPMGRNHVHCSTGTPEEGVTSGMRKDAELLIEIDLQRSVEQGGLKWWRSDNGVLLTEGGGDGIIKKEWFKKVEGRKGNVGVLWEDGQWKRDLPEGLHIRVPMGKGGRGGRGGGGGRGRGGGGRTEA